MGDTIYFPDDFLWGAATSAYQVEGSPLADGAGPSIWHRFSHTPGRTLRGETGDVACDQYHRFADDVARLAPPGPAGGGGKAVPDARARAGRERSEEHTAER